MPKKVGLLHPYNVLGGWNAVGGYFNVLKRMGHEVLHFTFPGNVSHHNQPSILQVEKLRKLAPTIEQLNECDVILSMYHEYTQPWLDIVYGFENWSKIKVPIVAKFDESFCRTDLGLPDRWMELRTWANYFYFPAVQDAERFGGKWMPFAVDTEMFNPRFGYLKDKRYEIGFIGTLYPTRRAYLENLARGAGNDLNFNVGQAVVQDIGGIRSEESMKLLAENYRQLKIFFCLPPMSRLIVEKVFEVMASGTFVMYPKFPAPAKNNLSLFENGKEISYYDMGMMPDNIAQIRYYLEHDDEREKIAEAGMWKVRKKFTLEQMFTELLSAGENKDVSKITRVPASV